jgi:adenosyl cobinamide kinase/adenosyl cobinamide phosphate guanylyltransferase
VTSIVLIGGARSGKSRLAQELAVVKGAPVTFIATATAGDQEMADKIAAHRLERPPEWSTREEPLDLAGALAATRDGETVIADCLTLWVANLIERGDPPDAVLGMASDACAAAAERSGMTIVVSNEVGLGVVPATELGRVYRNVLGEVNRIWASRADRAWFVVAGRLLPLAGVGEIADELLDG